MSRALPRKNWPSHRLTSASIQQSKRNTRAPIGAASRAIRVRIEVLTPTIRIRPDKRADGHRAIVRGKDDPTEHTLRRVLVPSMKG
jgi:hypothetical protein